MTCTPYGTAMLITGTTVHVQTAHMTPPAAPRAKAGVAATATTINRFAVIRRGV